VGIARGESPHRPTRYASFRDSRKEVAAAADAHHFSLRYRIKEAAARALGEPD
jgi:hypothetical protein